MTASNTFGRATVLPLTNKSGGGVVAGDVVVLDTTNNDAFTTTTSAATTQIVGIATGTIASNAVGLVLFSGYASLVNVNASVTRGHYGATHTVAKQAADAGATRASGTFCEFLTGGTTPDAIIYNPDLGGASLTNPMNAKGQMIVGDTGGTPSALAAGTTGYMLTAAGAGAFPAWAAPSGRLIAVHQYAAADGNWTRTTASLADVDATNAAITFTAPASGNVLIRASFFMGAPTANRVGQIGLRVGTTDVAGPAQLAYAASSPLYARMTPEWYVTGLTPGNSYTYKLAFMGDGTAACLIYYGPVTGGSNPPFVMTVWEAV